MADQNQTAADKVAAILGKIFGVAWALGLCVVVWLGLEAIDGEFGRMTVLTVSGTLGLGGVLLICKRVL